jgi:hypothetical protein
MDDAANVVVDPDRDAYTRADVTPVVAMQKFLLGPLLFAAPFAAQATVDCAGLPQSMPVRPTILAPVSSEFAVTTNQLGAQRGVLSHAYDESHSVDQVLLRLRIEGCQAAARALPAPSAVNPDDPAAYKPQTAFDNTPWRFDMSQDGKRMTAEEFDAWMKARGVRVARGAPQPAAAPEADKPEPEAQTPEQP